MPTIKFEMENNPYTEDLYTFKSFKKIKKKVNIGIDEAGRGPVLGHLVYAALIADNVPHQFMDSKTLTPPKREHFFEEIKKTYSYIYTAIHPAYLSKSMGAVSLNDISYNVVVEIIKNIIKEDIYTIDTVYLDALGPKDRYMNVLKTNFSKIKFVVENKADSIYKIVSGASIVAKVTRDELLKGWPLEDKDIGSGYPGDEITIKWLKRNFCPVFGFQSIVRFSWSTVKVMFDKRSSKPLKSPYTGFYLENR